jgi:protein-L-isoaspartate(D-aspartate) O-methyltransferase
MEQSSEKARFNMIQQQIRPWDVIDTRVLDVMMAVQREPFVPDAYKGLAYADVEIPLAGGQSMMAPKVVGRMLQALNLAGGDRVLEIGTGSGYVTACLARLAGEVISLELDAALLETARGNLDARNVELREGDALAAPVDGGPFNAIAVTGSLPAEQSVAALQEQLADGGRLFVVLGEAPAMQATLITRRGGGFSREVLFETELAALDKAQEAEHFVF